MAADDDAERTPAVDQINAMPTKAFFFDMLTKDIPLEQAVLDLVDNSVDGAKNIPSTSGLKYEGRRIRLRISAKAFAIWDNCGGFSTATARDYAFRFGRADQAPRLQGSIGQFGVGMKRALFKFGRHFIVRSTTTNERWSIDINVDEWSATSDDWHFPWNERKRLKADHALTQGTFIHVEDLRSPVSAKFSTDLFRTAVLQLIKAKHRQFISHGLQISLNGKHIDATNLFLLVRDDLHPGHDEFTVRGKDESDVIISITVGVGVSSPRESGWYVICNGRVVLEADRTIKTGWGFIENRIAYAPAYHNQYARFRGIVSFDSLDSSRVPWNTTKDNVDSDSSVWQKAFSRMMEMMRPVLDFLNRLDADVDEYTREHSALFQHVERADRIRSDTVHVKRDFSAPRRESISSGPRQVKIQYLKPIDDIEFLEAQLNVTSAKAVGEKTFDLSLKRYKR